MMGYYQLSVCTVLEMILESLWCYIKQILTVTVLIFLSHKTSIYSFFLGLMKITYTSTTIAIISNTRKTVVNKLRTPIAVPNSEGQLHLKYKVNCMTFLLLTMVTYDSALESASPDVLTSVHVVELYLSNTADTQQLYVTKGINPLSSADVFPPKTVDCVISFVFLTM